MKEAGIDASGGGLSECARDAYGRITRHEALTDQDTAAVDELRAWGLVTADPDLPDIPVALDPQEAGRRRLESELRGLAERASHLAGIPEASDGLALHFERAKWRSGRGSEFLSEPGVVNARIGDALGSAREELLTAQPGGPRNRELLQIAVDRDSKALERGVSVRTLYLDSVRDDAVTREWATTMTGLGANFRTLVRPFQRCVIVDRKQAFISDYVVKDAPAHAAWHVMDRAMVAWIAEGFEESWRRAEVWHGQARAAENGPAGTRTTRVQREILRDMAGGVEQRVTAERVGMSLRKLTYEIGQLRTLWGVSTLAELTYRWALSPDRLVDDEVAQPVAAAV
jgi:hypothetical protein